MSHELENTSTDTQNMQKPVKNTKHNKWQKVLKEEEETSDKNVVEALREDKAEDNTQKETEFVARSDYNTLEKRMEELKKQLEEAENKVLYVEAAKRNERNLLIEENKRDKLRETTKIIGSLLPFLDSIEESLKQATTLEHFEEGTKKVLSQLKNIFEKLGVTAVDSEIGSPFDPNIHSAISTESVEEQPAESVVKVYQKGYKLGERVIRSAMVVVNAKKE